MKSRFFALFIAAVAFVSFCGMAMATGHHGHGKDFNYTDNSYTENNLNPGDDGNNRDNVDVGGIANDELAENANQQNNAYDSFNQYVEDYDYSDNLGAGAVQADDYADVLYGPGAKANDGGLAVQDVLNDMDGQIGVQLTGSVSSDPEFMAETGGQDICVGCGNAPYAGAIAGSSGGVAGDGCTGDALTGDAGDGGGAVSQGNLGASADGGFNLAAAEGAELYNFDGMRGHNDVYLGGADAAAGTSNGGTVEGGNAAPATGGDGGNSGDAATGNAQGGDANSIATANPQANFCQDINARFANSETIGQGYANAQNNMVMGQGEGAVLGVTSTVLNDSFATTDNMTTPATQ